VARLERSASRKFDRLDLASSSKSLTTAAVCAGIEAESNFHPFRLSRVRLMTAGVVEPREEVIMTERFTTEPFLTVEEAAGRLRISRTAAYSLARQWLESGRDGIPAVRIGRSIRIPATAFEHWARGLPFQS
jgi:excisionase family DNA binding protein